MAAAAHGFIPVTARQTTLSGAYVDVPGAVILNTSLVAGHTYLLLVTAQADTDDANATCFLRVAHGASFFDHSEQSDEPETIGGRMQYAWLHVWTAVAGEDLKLQFHRQGATATAGVDTIGMFWLDLASFVQGTDWDFNEVSAATTLDGSESTTNNASVTITPAAGGDRWLVLGCARHTTFNSLVSNQSRLLRTGEATETLAEVICEGEDAASMYEMFTAADLTLGSVSNTFTEKSLLSAAGTTEARTRSAVFVIDLAKFRNSVGSRTAGATDLSATDYATNLETVSLTPDVAGDVWSFGYLVHKPGTVQNYGKHRLQIDNADDPANQTTNAYLVNEVHDPRDQRAHVIQTVTNLTGAHTFDLDASTKTAGAGKAGLYRSLIAVTMELPAGGSAATVKSRIVQTRQAPVRASRW